ncbi:MAG: hypothetical protein HY047_08855 [Acidobacteria bacterium]|nr:hypothetical protein [Acidobacteriota bacterium]
MTCRQCGAAIAEKALICYKCGTATTKATYQPAAPPRRGVSTRVIASIVALVLLAAAASFVGGTSVGETPRLFTWIVVAIAVVIVGLRAYARRR